MGCCLTSALCCAGQALCSCLCMPCAKAGVEAKNFAKIGFVIHQIFWIGISLLLMVSAKKLVDKFPAEMLNCPDASGGSSSCLGASSIIRMSFALTVFHLFMFVVVITRNKVAAAFHDGCWLTKILLVAGVFTGSMWINNSFMVTYMNLSKYVSTVFLIYQALLMLLVSYKINDTLVSNFNKDPTSCSKWILILVSAFFLSATVYTLIKQYKDFSCGSNTFIMIISTVAVIAMHVLVFFKPRPDASILTSSIASVYILYLQWSALSSDQNSQCNPNLNQGSNVFWQIFLGLFVTFVSLGMSGATIKSEDEPEHDKEKEAESDDEDTKTKPILDENQRASQKKHKLAESHVFAISNATIIFQVTMIFSAIYLAMLCTNWGSVTVFDNTTDFFQHSQGSFWLKIVAQWFTIGIFLFSLVGPMLFPNRDFGQN